mmetsp:Transcript_18496/g.26118  ORF Transcript_18496/g.26118 Transcript_18496/m.26118 type:complete len:953 (+) Transcript_18496:319-3177(+)
MTEESLAQTVDPVSWNHIGLHGYSVGTFTADNRGIHWKSALGAGTPEDASSESKHLSRKVLAGAKWTVFGRSAHLRVELKNSSEWRLDGFPPSDYETIKTTLKSKYNIDVTKHSMCTAGESFGNTTIQTSNNHLAFHQCILEDADEEGQEFEPRDGDEMMTLDLKQVSQCVLPGNNRNEIELQFPESDTVEVGTDQLVSIRFYIPPDPEADPQDKAQPSAAELVQSRIMKTANIKNTTGDVICEFDENRGTFLTPRGRYKIELYDSFLRMRGNKYDYKIRYDDISRLFLLPKPDDVHMAFVIALDKPIRQGQQRYQYLVLQTTKEQEEIALNVDEDILEKEYNGDLQPVMTGSLSNLVAKTFKVIARKKVFVPGKFANASQQACVKCALRANEGHLYPLEKQFIFIHKPPVLIRFDEVESVEFQRYAGGVGSTRNFDLCVTLASAASSQQQTKEYTFSGIDRSDYAGLYNFLSTKRIRIKNLQEATDALNEPVTGPAPAAGGETEINYAEEDFDDGGSDDESYDVNAKDSDDESGGGPSGDDDNDNDLDSDDLGSEIDMDNDSDLEEARAAVGIPRKSKKKKESSSTTPKKKKKKKARDGGDDSDEEPPKKKKKKSTESCTSPKKKKKKDPNAPKRAKTAFMYFSTANRARLKEENPDASFGELGKLVGEAWKNLSEDDKEMYERKANSDKERYKTEMADYSADEDFDNDDDSDKDTKSSGKAKKDPNAPKGAKSAYILFLSEQREKIKAKNPDLNFAELSKKVGATFKALSDEEREKWDQLAKQDKQRYLHEMKDYVPADGFGKDGKQKGGSGKGKKGKKAKKDPNAPKRPMTAYFFFSNEQRPLIKGKNPDIKFGDIAVQISKKFKTLSNEEKEKYNKLASKDKERYKNEMASYKSKQKTEEESNAKEDTDDDDSGAKDASDDDGDDEDDVEVPSDVNDDGSDEDSDDSD